MRTHERIVNRNICNMRIANTGSQIVTRLTLGGVDYHGAGQTLAYALAALDADIEGAALDCDCVLPEHTCSTCCPREVVLENIPF